MNGQRSFRFFALAVVCFLFLTITGQGAEGQSNGTDTDPGTPPGQGAEGQSNGTDTDPGTPPAGSNDTDTFDTYNDTATTTPDNDDAGNDTSSFDEFTDDPGAVANTTSPTDETGDNTTSSDLDFTPEPATNDTEEVGTTEDPDYPDTTTEDSEDTMFSNDTALVDTTDDTGNATDDEVPEPSTVVIDDESGTLEDADTTADPQNTTATDGEVPEPSVVEVFDESGTVMGNDTDVTPAFDADNETMTVEEDENALNETTDAPADDDNTTMTSPAGELEPEDATAEGQNATDTVIPVDSGAESDQTVVQRKPEKADFIVYDNNGKPCLLASINITIWFKYHIQEGLIRETYTVSQKDEKDDSSYVGSCEGDRSALSITWNNNTFTLNLTFALEDRAVEERTKEDGLEMDVLPEGVNSTSSWSLHQVALTYDTTNDQFFPGASNPSVKTVDPATVDLFKTPLGLSYLCQTPGAVRLQFKDVEMVFNYVRLQPFAPQSAYFANETVECSGDMSTMPMTDSSTTVPLVVAACLAAAVIVIIIGYAIHRCMTRHRHGEYKPMD